MVFNFIGRNWAKKKMERKSEIYFVFSRPLKNSFRNSQDNEEYIHVYQMWSGKMSHQFRLTLTDLQRIFRANAHLKQHCYSDELIE